MSKKSIFSFITALILVFSLQSGIYAEKETEKETTSKKTETVDDKERLTNIIEALEELDDMNIIFPIHPRTKKTMENFGLFDRLNDLKHVHIIKPVGYLDFLLLISKSTIILTDSGGLQEEAITLDVPALTLRYNTERPETVTAGGNILVGSDKEVIRGRHANYNSEFVLINVAGTSKVKVDDGTKQKVFNLDRPHIGIYIPKLVWKDMYDFSEDSVLLVLSSEHYDANEYIRDYEEYLKIVRNQINE